MLFGWLVGGGGGGGVLEYVNFIYYESKFKISFFCVCGGERGVFF